MASFVGIDRLPLTAIETVFAANLLAAAAMERPGLHRQKGHVSTLIVDFVLVGKKESSLIVTSQFCNEKLM